MAGQGNRNRRPLNETNNDLGNFFSNFMNSSKTGVGTPQARDLGSPSYYGPGGNPIGSGEGQAQQNPGMGPYQGFTPGLPRPSQPAGAPAMGGDTSMINANGVQQTGKQMTVSAAFVPEYANSSFNQLLAGVNRAKIQPFSSEQLPTTAGSPDSNIGPVTDSVAYADMLQNAPGAGTVGVGPLADEAAYAKAVEGKGKSPSRLDAALSDTAGMQSYMSKFSSGDQQRAANRAFLDTEGSMAGLRAKEKANNVVYAGGQHYIPGTSGDDQAIAIDRSQARDISNGKSSAQSLLQAHIDKNKDAALNTPAAAQDPVTNFQQGLDSSVSLAPSMNKQLTVRDFDLNNDEGTGFAAPKGYKPTTSYKEPTFPNPFSR